jgi:hypothetical protein
MFLIAVDGEVMLVEDFDDTTPTDWTVTRGQNGTSSSQIGHLAGAFVALVANRFAPLVDDVVDDNGDELSGRVLGFGRAVMQPDPTPPPSGASFMPLARLVIAPLPPSNPAATGAIVQNASSAFLKPFAADLQGSANLGRLWNTLLSTFDPNASSNGMQNAFLVPALVSTNVPPQQ